MGVELTKTTLLLLLITASLLSISCAVGYAGRQSSFVDTSFMEMSAAQEESASKNMRHGKASDVHERLLRYNTKDYGSYDSTPTLSKPPFKLIPN